MPNREEPLLLSASLCFRLPTRMTIVIERKRGLQKRQNLPATSGERIGKVTIASNVTGREKVEGNWIDHQEGYVWVSWRAAASSRP